MHAYGNDFNINFDEKASGKWFKANKLFFQASHAQTGAPVFRVESDGSKNASVQTFSNGDPVNSILAAFAVSIKLDPKEFYGVCKKYCLNNISLHSYPSMCGGFGLNDVEYAAQFATMQMGTAVAPMPEMGFTYGVPVAEAVPVDSAGISLLVHAQPFTVPTGEAVAFEPIVVEAIVLPAITEDMAGFANQVAANEAKGTAADNEGGDDEGEGGDDNDDGDPADDDNDDADADEKAFFTERES